MDFGNGTLRAAILRAAAQELITLAEGLENGGAPPGKTVRVAIGDQVLELTRDTSGPPLRRRRLPLTMIVEEAVRARKGPVLAMDLAALLVGKHGVDRQRAHQGVSNWGYHATRRRPAVVKKARDGEGRVTYEWTGPRTQKGTSR